MAKKQPGSLALTPRVKDILRLLDHTPLPAHLIREASVTFGSAEYPEGEFRSDRRVRQKLQQLVDARLASEHEFTITGRGVMKFFQTAPSGYRALHGTDPPEERRRFFRPIARLNWEHTYANARAIVKTLIASHQAGIRVTNFCRENELTLATGSHAVEPDHLFQFCADGRYFNCFYEIDLNTETLQSQHPKAWQQRILAYEAYQDWLLQIWKQNGCREPQARFRVHFLTTTTDHAYRFLVPRITIVRPP